MNAQLIIDEADRLRHLVDKLSARISYKNRLLIFAKHWRMFYAFALLDSSKAITLLKDYDPSIPDVKADGDKLQQVLLNIVRNAMQALSEGGHINVKPECDTMYADTIRH